MVSKRYLYPCGFKNETISNKVESEAATTTKIMQENLAQMHLHAVLPRDIFYTEKF